MVKNKEAFFGTPPFLPMLSGSIRTTASEAKAEKALLGQPEYTIGKE